MIRFSIDDESPLPAYQQIKRTILLNIMSGRLTLGDRLPSIRDMAKMLKLNPNTVAKSYYKLEADGFILGRRGSGYVIKYQKPKIDNLKKGILEDEFKSFLANAFAMGFTKEDIKDLTEKLLENQ